MSYVNLTFIAGIVIMAIVQGCTPNSPKQSIYYQRIQALGDETPIAPVKEYKTRYHGITLVDNYHWLKDQGYPEVDDQAVIAYLKAENQYYANFIEPHKKLINTLFEEFKGRENDQDASVPWQKNGYEYRWFYREGENYKTWVRKKLGTKTEEVFLDETKLAQGYEYFSIEEWDISPNNQYLAYTLDTDGSERSVIRIVDLNSNKLLDDTIIDSAGEVTFSHDSQHVIYTLLQKDKWQTVSLNTHKIGTPLQQDTVLVREEDDSYFLRFDVTSNGRYLISKSSDRVQDEVFAFNLHDLSQAPIKLSDRAQNKLLKVVDHGNGHFYILTNDTHVNFRLVKTPENLPEQKHWQTLVTGSDARYLTDIQVFQEFLAVNQSVDGLESVTIYPELGEPYDVQLPESVAAVGLGNNPEFSQTHVRINYESMITPDSVYDYQISEQKLALRKIKSIPSGYNKNDYHTERIMVPARDGVKVPVTLVYKQEFKKDQNHPLYLYGYGAYGLGLSPSFSSLRLSLLDRGFVYAYAHVRGGDELGYKWYLDGKLNKRTNTFNDFIDVAQHLIDKKYVAKGNISIGGRSAGGELMGAAVIQAPDLWRSVNLGVPFVDVLNTMLDATLPLTPPEWQEWGNPIEDKSVYQFIQSYSPYDNIQAREYPPMLVTGGLNDPRVTYWEPAKWTAKMRATKTDNNLLVMRINMGAGHFANTGRYGRLKDYAEEYAFTLLAHGITK
ncbi:S9 family peptidase [Paraglaciecola aquimarina]|uniref:S9 family peptidase n=1 Tax=Paraglaciecola algarum TaxID=3050085 RepID=A0ABS9DAS9_9ALTE|nr:S9 family peptidase [Paraglaciecola sp. G1-23]MCF2950023.1 S9 family peptidase [Paraglaciecola sp. G1-23]